MKSNEKTSMNLRSGYNRGAHTINKKNLMSPYLSNFMNGSGSPDHNTIRKVQLFTTQTANNNLFNGYGN